MRNLPLKLTSQRMALAVMLGAALTLAGCGPDADPGDGSSTAPSAGSGGATGAGNGDGSSGGGDSTSGGGSGSSAGGGGGEAVGGASVAAKGAKVRYDRDDRLQLVVTPRLFEVGRGDPILVDLVLKNIGKEPVRLVQPKKDLSENFTLRVAYGDKRFVMRRRGWTSDNKPTGVRISTLEPGMSVKATADLHQMLSGTPGYASGGLKFEVEYRGAAELTSAETDLWNPDGRGFLRSPHIFVEVLESPWLADYEQDEEKLREHKATAINAARIWSRTHPKKDAMVTELVEKGEVVVACLISLVEQMDQPESDKHELAGKAFDMLRAMPEAAFPILKRSVVERAHPARVMLLEVFEEDRRQATKQTPSRGLTAVRALAGGAETGATLTIRVEGNTPKPVSFTLLPDGKLSVERSEKGRAYAFTADLGSRQLLQLKKELLASRIWCWKGVRSSPVPGEGEAQIVLRAPNGFSLQVRILENELRTHNSLSAPVMKLLEHLTSHVPPPPVSAAKPLEDK